MTSLFDFFGSLQSVFSLLKHVWKAFHVMSRVMLSESEFKRASIELGVAVS